MSFPIVKLGDVVDFIGGSQPAKSNFIYEEKEGYIRLLQIRDYKSDKNLTYISKSSTKKFCNKSDVMIGRYGPPVFQILRGLEGAYNVALMKAKPSEKVNNDYLYYFLRQGNLFKLIDSLSQRTAGQSGVDMTALKKYPMLLPALAEQQKIAAILDAADQLRQKDQQLIDHYTTLSQSLFLEMFGDPVINPMGWEFVSLKSLARKIGSGSTPRGGKKAYLDKGISLVRSLNIHDAIFRYKNLAFINEDQAALLSSVCVEKKDVLINITGASVCRCAIVPSKILPARVNQHVCIVRVNQAVLNHIFLLYLIVSKQFKRKLFFMANSGGATREALTKAQIERLLILLPPIDLQTQFAQHIEKIEHQKQQAQASLEKSETLFNSLLQHAFKGELTQAN